MTLYSEAALREAVHSCWISRQAAQHRQTKDGQAADVGLRSGVTSGKHLDPLTNVIAKVFLDAGIPAASINFSTGVALPGFYRPQKRWDIVVVHDGELVAAIELKSILGSYGNNLNNRSEEAIGNSVDLLEAYEEGLLGKNSRAPWLGYLFVMQSDPGSNRPVGVKSPHFPPDEVFVDASYIRRAEILCRRLIQKRLYSGACLIVSDGSGTAAVSEPAPDLTFSKFAAGIAGRAGEALA